MLLCSTLQSSTLVWTGPYIVLPNTRLKLGHRVSRPWSETLDFENLQEKYYTEGTAHNYQCFLLLLDDIACTPCIDAACCYRCSVVCLSVSLCACLMCVSRDSVLCRKTAAPIEMPVGRRLAVVVSVVGRTNEVNQHRARLVP